MTCHSEYLRRAVALKKSHSSLKLSGLCNFNTVSEAVADKTYRCLLGQYLIDTGLSVCMGEAAEHFGITETQAAFLFGGGSGPTLTERGYMVDELLRQAKDSVNEIEIRHINARERVA